MLENKLDFLKKFNIQEKEFKKSKLKWEDLKAIYQDFSGKIQHLNSIGQTISNALQVQQGVHSVRYRVKDAEHLIEKIIRKVAENPARVINLNNYESEITDLVGVRAIHLFKSNWKPINSFIKDTWELHETPIAYIRSGDSEDVRTTFDNEKFDVKEHKIGYRSLHYIIKTKPTRIEHFVEIQVRTLFEECWSEIDHKIRYPYNTDNELIRSLLMIFNRLAGSADEMADYVRTLGIALKGKEQEYLISLSAREQEIELLKEEIGRLKIKPQQRTKLFESLEQISKMQKPYGLSAALTDFGKLSSDIAKLGVVAKLNHLDGLSSTLTEIGKLNIGSSILSSPYKDLSIDLKGNPILNINKGDDIDNS